MASSLSASDEAGHTTSSPDEEVFHPLMGGHPMHPFFPLMVSLVVGPQGQLPFWNGVYDTELVLVDRAASEDLKRKGIPTQVLPMILPMELERMKRGVTS